MSDENQTEPAPTSDPAVGCSALLDRLNALPGFSEAHAEGWRNQVARDLNHLVGRAIWWIETDGDEIDAEFGAAVLRTVERVVEFDGIEAV